MKRCDGAVFVWQALTEAPGFAKSQTSYARHHGLEVPYGYNDRAHRLRQFVLRNPPPRYGPPGPPKAGVPEMRVSDGENDLRIRVGVCQVSPEAASRPVLRGLVAVEDPIPVNGHV